MNKGRLEAFTDAVIAIAATIMVLEMRPPEENSVRALLALWPVFVSYTVSFALIYVVWYSHHNIFRKAEVISPTTFFLNGMWLFFLTLVPFATAWIGKHPDETLPEFVYTLVLLLWSLSFQLMDHRIVRDNPDQDADVSDRPLLRAVLYGGISLAMLFSFFFPIVSLIIMSFASITTVVGMLYGSKHSTQLRKDGKTA